VTALSHEQHEIAPPHVLVVDDNRDGADGLSMLFEGWGCQTSAAYNGHEAIKVAISTKPDMVVLDLCMPQPNGIETCQRLREQPWAADIVIVGVTGSWIAQEAAQLKGSFDGVFLKPDEVVPLRGFVNILQRLKRRDGIDDAPSIA
jgi:CheY-like chemotaxis protein